MPPRCTSGHHALEVIIHSPGAMVDDVVFQCPDLTWNQVFLAIDRLSRDGALTVTPKGQGHYSVQMSDQTTLDVQPVVAG
ncbi:MAG: hypothetical protein U0236_04930 [Nitrospira sp.]